MSRPITSGNGSCRAVRSQRHLATHFDAAGKTSTIRSIEDEIKIKQDNEVVATMKAEQCQDEVSSGNERKRGKHQATIKSSITCQKRCNSATS